MNIKFLIKIPRGSILSEQFIKKSLNLSKCRFDWIEKLTVKLDWPEWPTGNTTSGGQSYKHFMFVNYNSMFVKWGIFESGKTLES